MKNIWRIIVLFTFCSNSIYAQKQQYIDYDIRVTLNDQKHILYGEISMVYKNNSNDTLRDIFIHLWPNAYSKDYTDFSKQKVKNGSTEFYFSKAHSKGNIDSLFFSLDGVPVEYTYFQDKPDIAYIEFVKPILPGQKIKIHTPFRVKIPDVFSRLGHKGQEYCISQWYPKPAVYDNHGWNPIPYLDQGEFYSEFGDYKVEIKLPKNYVVASTGELEDTVEIQWMDSIRRAHEIIIKPDTNLEIPQVPSSSEFKTIHLHQQNVHDFAWAASKKYILKKSTRSIQNKNVDIWSFVSPNHIKVWKESNEYGYRALAFGSDKIGPYPYAHMSIVDAAMVAGEGMEYPCFTILHGGDTSSLASVIYHEVIHNWFYGILANNERVQPFMDESWTSFCEKKISKLYGVHDKKKKQKSFSDFQNLDLQLYLLSVGKNKNYSMNSSEAFSSLQYGTYVYSYGTRILDYLEAYLGEAEFWNLVQSYYLKYKFQHVDFDNLKQHFNLNASKSTHWFFDSLVFEPQGLDFKIANLQKRKDSIDVKIKHNWKTKMPVSIVTVGQNNDTSTIWTDPITSGSKITISNNNPKIIWLNKNINIPETKFTNNEYKLNTVFHKFQPQLKPLIGTLNFSNFKNNIYFLLPTIGYNEINGIMIGAALHNVSIPFNSNTFIINPMYANRSKSLTGQFLFDKLIPTVHSNLLESVSLKLNAKSFGLQKYSNNFIAPSIFQSYVKINPSLSLKFNNHDETSKKSKILNMGYYQILSDNILLDSNDVFYKNNMNSVSYFQVEYKLRDQRMFNPYGYSIDLMGNNTFARLNLNASSKLNYNYSKKGMALKLYGSYIKEFDANTNFDNGQYPTSTGSAKYDYLFNHTFLARSKQSGFFSQQITTTNGLFKNPTLYYGNNIGTSNGWLINFSAEFDIPNIQLPFKWYIDLGTFYQSKSYLADGRTLMTSSGIVLDLSLVKLYMPVLNSKDFRDYNKNNLNYFGMLGRNFFKTISFELDLDRTKEFRNIFNMVF